jgi:uncharacterized protein YjbJ (UPF0337 family)
MNWGRIEGNFRQMKGVLKERLGKLTDDEVEMMAGRRDKLVGVIQGRYGRTRDEAEARVDFLEKAFSDETRH